MSASCSFFFLDKLTATEIKLYRWIKPRAKREYPQKQTFQRGRSTFCTEEACLAGTRTGRDCYREQADLTAGAKGHVTLTQTCHPGNGLKCRQIFTRLQTHAMGHVNRPTYQLSRARKLKKRERKNLYIVDEKRTRHLLHPLREGHLEVVSLLVSEVGVEKDKIDVSFQQVHALSPQFLSVQLRGR